MPLDKQDLQAIKELLQENNQTLLKEVDTRMKQQTLDIGAMFNQVMEFNDRQFATKSEVQQVKEEVARLKVAMGFVG